MTLESIINHGIPVRERTAKCNFEILCPFAKVAVMI